MIPKIANRGSSFKGAHHYYGHDKQADTTERVLFFETLNMRTDDPDKAWKVMAFTAQHEEQLKKANAIHWNGQATEQPVYSFSLAWDTDQTPSQDDMKAAMISALKHRNMDELQAILYGHNDTDNIHGHVLVNLIHPETGKTADIWQDQLELSEWAERYEREHGGIRCEQRVDNNEKRREGEFVKHRDHAIQNAWDQSTTGQEFSDLLEAKGYLLAQGNKRLVIVDPYGKTINPTRMIAGDDGKNIKANMLNDRLADLDQTRIQSAQDAIKRQAERDYFDRDNYHAQQDEKNIDAAIQADRIREPGQDDAQRDEDDKRRIAKEQAALEAARLFKQQEAKTRHQNAYKKDLEQIIAKGSFAEELDEIRAAEAIKDKEAARIDYLFGQQRKNIEEGRKRGLIPDHEEIEQPEPEPHSEPVPDIQEQYEQAAAPAPEVEPPAPAPPVEYSNPIPDYDHSAEIITQQEPVGTPAPEQTPQQYQSRDSGGYER